METETVFLLIYSSKRSSSIWLDKFSIILKGIRIWTRFEVIRYNMVFNTSHAPIEGWFDCDCIRDSWETEPGGTSELITFLKFNSCFKVAVERFTFMRARLCVCALMFSALLCEDLYSQYESSCIECVHMCVCMCCYVKIWSQTVYTCTVCRALTAAAQQHLGDVCVLVQQGIV